MKAESGAPNSRKTSKELLNIPENKCEEVIKSLLHSKKQKLAPDKRTTFKVERSSIFDRVKEFLPVIKTSTDDLMAKDEKELDKLNIENTEDCEKVIEMDILVGEMNDREDSSCSDSDSSNDEISRNDENFDSANVNKKNLISEL